MEGPKKIYRMGQCWCEKPTHEDNKGYVPADLTDALAEAVEKVVLAIDEAQIVWILDAGKKLKDALAAYRGEEK